MNKIYLAIILSFCFVSVVVATDVPAAPSDVHIDAGNNTLIVQTPDSAAKPFVIKGVSWAPASKAPINGPNPLNLNETVDYGFFFDWDGRYPQGNEILNYWLKNALAANYQRDIPLIKSMNANTVRIYHALGSNLEDYNNVANQITQVLDECYRNGIMVIMTVAISKDDLQDQFYIYKDNAAVENHFVPSGWMGDTGDLVLENAAANPKEGRNCIKITYSAARSNGQGWAGIYWQQPENNWGTVPAAGYNLTGAKRLTFWARSENGGEFITFKLGGISGQYGDSGYITRGITLTNTWQKYTIDLTGINLSRIIGGFSFTVSLSPKTFYLDEIRYEGNDIYCQTNEKRYVKLVNAYKNHPAILMWSLGNEWNLNGYYGFTDMTEAALATNEAAAKIKSIDPHHPVSSCLGDRFSIGNYGSCGQDQAASDIPSIVNACTNVDLWGINLYRGTSFGELFNQWKVVTTNKPFYVSEFGIDSYFTQGYIPDGNCLIRAKSVVGAIDEQRQADVDVGLWREIKNHLSLYNPGELCLGGLIHEFNDELWKAGSYHLGLGGLFDYANNHSYDEYNAEGFVLPGARPDNVLNEEYFGLVTTDRVLKKAYLAIKQEFNSPPEATSISPSSGNISQNQATIFTATYTDPDGWQNTRYAYLLFNTSVSGINCMYGYYNQNSNKLYLRNDTNTAWLGGFAPGSANTIENSYSKLNCAQTTVSGSGNTLTVKWNVTFKSAFSGNKNIYMNVDDDTGVYTDWILKGNITLPNNPPATGTISPSSGTIAVNAPTIFTATYIDSNGWQNIRYMYLLFNTSVSGSNCFYGYYDRNANKLYLRNDTNTAWLGGFAPGSANIIENSYSKLNCAQTTVSGSGNTLTLKWNLTFKSTFSGNKNIYLNVTDYAGAYTGFILKGNVTVPNNPPAVGTLAPSSATIAANTPTIFTSTYTDPDGWQNTRYAYLLFNASVSGINCLYAYYDQNVNKLYLRNDTNTAWLGGFVPGSANTIENSYSKLNCAQTTVSGSGNTLTVKWNVTFKPTFSGNKNIYMNVTDDAGAYVSWTKKGTLLVQ